MPAPFVKEHFRELERVVTLENDEGKSWRVSFGRAKAYPQWFQGWKRVDVDNDLKPGDVIVFVLKPHSRFHFTRFDEHGNILSKKRTQSPQIHATAEAKRTIISSTHSASPTHEKPGSVTHPEDSLHRRTSWKSKQAAALASRTNHPPEPECGVQPSQLRFDCHHHPTHKQAAEAESLSKRRMLCKAGGIVCTATSTNESNLAINHALPGDDCGEAASASMAYSPSAATIAAPFPSTTESHE